MNRVVYHGSDHIIEQPEYGKGMRNNDYGRGFYCTENLELAKEWACAKQKDGYANIYELDMSRSVQRSITRGKCCGKKRQGRSTAVQRSVPLIWKNYLS